MEKGSSEPQPGLATAKGDGPAPQYSASVRSWSGGGVFSLGLVRLPLAQLTPGPCLGLHWAWGALAHQHFRKIPQPVSKLISITHIPCLPTHKISCMNWQPCGKWSEALLLSNRATSWLYFNMVASTQLQGNSQVVPLLSTLSRKQKLLKSRLSLHLIYYYSSHRGIGSEREDCCCCSVTKLCLTVWNPMDCSTPHCLSFTISWDLFKFMSIEWMMLSNHLILCCPPSPFAFNLSQLQGLLQHLSLTL